MRTTVLDSLSFATAALKEATDAAERARRELERVAPRLADDALGLELRAEDLLVKVSHAREALQGAGL